MKKTSTRITAKTTTALRPSPSRGRRLWVALAYAVIASTLAACGGGTKSAPPIPTVDPNATPTAFFDTAPTFTPVPGATSVATKVPPTPSGAACATAAAHAADNSNETLQSGGLARTYILHVPPSYDGARDVPLVINLHGFGSNAAQQAAYSQLPAKADREGFVVVTPNGTGNPQHWEYPGLGGAVDDIAFIRELLDRVEADLCIDAKRVFVTGISNGAAIATFIACAMPDRITAIAPVAATAGPASCAAGAIVPVITFRGTDDPCVPYGGGTSACGQKLPVAAAETSVQNWAAHDGCNPSPAKQEFSAHVRTIAYSECTSDAAVVMFVVEGGGHTWPGSVDVPRLGTTTHEVNATDQMWQFFLAQGNLRR